MKKTNDSNELDTIIILRKDIIKYDQVLSNANERQLTNKEMNMKGKEPNYKM